MTIEERLERIERELSRAKRHTRWLLVGLVLVVAGAFIERNIAQAQGQVPKEIRARAFVLEDKTGHVRAHLEMTRTCEAAAFATNKDEAEAVARLFPCRPELVLFDEPRWTSQNRPLADTAKAAISAWRSRPVSSTSSAPQGASRSGLWCASCAARI